MHLQSGLDLAEKGESAVFHVSDEIGERRTNLDRSDIDATSVAKDIGYRLSFFWVATRRSRSVTLEKSCPMYFILKAGRSI